MADNKPKLHSDNGNKPEFDFSDFSRAESKHIAKVYRKARFVNAKMNDDSLLAQMSFDEFEQLEQQAQDLEREANEMIVKRLVSMPRDWLVTSAPDNIDWSDPESLGYLRGNMSGALQEAFGEAGSPESVTKN